MSALRWSKDGTLCEVNGARLRSVTANFLAHKTTAEEIVILKSRRILEDYLSRFAGAKNVFEFGVYEGGSPALFAAALEVDRYVGIELNKDCPAFEEWRSQHEWGKRISLHYGVSQDDGERIPNILREEFAGRPLDVIIDDASHQYAPTRRAFELAFPYLRPGGVYAIEDWGWAHWGGEEWQRALQWSDREALSYLIFELTMASASSAYMISRVDVDGPVAYITKGRNASIGGELSLDKLYQSQGRRLTFGPATSPKIDARAAPEGMPTIAEPWLRDRPWIDKDDADIAGYVSRLASKPSYDLEAKLRHWRDQGFVVFEGAAQQPLIETLLEDIAAFKRSYCDYTIPIEVRGRQILSTDERSFPDDTGVKINHLHCYSRAAALISLAPEVCDFLRHVFRAPPAVLQSLTFWRGSEQKIHVDYPYVNYQKRLAFLAAAWVALEDISPDAGPLGYYPGGHQVSTTGFFDWGNNAIVNSSKSTRTPIDFADYLSARMATARIAKKVFCPRRGDIFIWHGNLPHEGTEVRDPNLTRKSYVTHYTSLADLPEWLNGERPDDKMLVNGGYSYVGPTHANRARLPSWEALRE
jgi:phytanoyl-CoA hydroxylase